jgi:peptidyl-tRNA hydrolase
LGSREYPRLRIGVGPSEERKGVYPNLADFVLAPFARDERDDVLSLMPTLVAAAESWLRDGVEKAMYLYNRAPDGEPGADSKGN